MKKILTFVLACVMLTSVFAVNVFAADHTIGGENGVTTFNPTEQGGNIVVVVNAVTHNYAVDIEYTNDQLTIPGVKWDVNTLTYVEANAGTYNAFNAKDFVVNITNYSDLPVNASVAVVDLQNADSIAFTANQASITGNGVVDNTKAYDDQTKTASATINAATAGTQIANAPKGTFTVDMECTDFHAMAAYYEGKEGDALKAASFTITVSIPPQN